MVYRRLHNLSTRTPTHRLSDVRLLVRRRYLVQAAKRAARFARTPRFLGWPTKLPDTDIFGNKIELAEQETHSPFKRVQPLPPVPDFLVDHIPLKLHRPEIPPVDPEKVYAVDPNLTGSSIQDIRMCQAVLGLKLLGFFKYIHVEPPKSTLRKSINIMMTDSGLAVCPTHVFGVFTSPGPLALPSPAERVVQMPMNRRKVSMFPIHYTPFISACANLPRLPRQQVRVAKPKDPYLASSYALTVPLVPLRLPHVESFPAIAQYLYFGYPWHIHVRLVPPRATAIRQTTNAVIPLPQFVERLTTMADLETLQKHARLIYGFYQNVIVLGISDAPLWVMIDYTWEGVATALRQVGGAGVLAEEAPLS